MKLFGKTDEKLKKIKNNYMRNYYVVYFYYLFSVIIKEKIDFLYFKSDREVAYFFS